MIEKLKIINEKYIEEYKENPHELKKYEIIKKILDEKDCFLKTNIEYAYAILRDLNIPEDKIKEVYLELISIN